MIKNKYRAAIWGAGSIGQTHARALSDVGVEVEVVCDINIDNAKNVAKLCNAKKVTTDKDELLNSNVDAVHVCLPANLHYAALITLINIDCNFICEKPLVLNNQEALDLVEKVKEKNILTGVGFNIRFHQGIQEVKRIIDSDEFGSLRLIHGEYLQEYNAFPALKDWRYNEKTAGKMRAVTEIGSHWFDLVQYVTSKKITDVSSTFVKFSKKRKIVDNVMYPLDHDEGDVINVESEDAAIITMRFNDEVVGNCVLSESSPGRVNYLALEIVSDRMTLKWNSEDVNTYFIGEKNKGFRRMSEPFGGGFADTYRKFFNSYYSDIGKEKVENYIKYPTLEDGVHNVLICNAAYNSALNNSEWISI